MGAALPPSSPYRAVAIQLVEEDALGLIVFSFFGQLAGVTAWMEYGTFPRELRRAISGQQFHPWNPFKRPSKHSRNSDT
jgi:hypothetical protein